MTVALNWNLRICYRPPMGCRGFTQDRSMGESAIFGDGNSDVRLAVRLRPDDARRPEQVCALLPKCDGMNREGAWLSRCRKWLEPSQARCSVPSVVGAARRQSSSSAKTETPKHIRAELWSTLS
jgi:hypothetical protein